MKVRIGDDGTLHCPACNHIMWKLYWKDRYKISRVGWIFTEWYGCGDCGKYIYDKHTDTLLSQFIEKGEENED